MQRAAYACAHRIVANSRAAADRLLRRAGPAGKIAVVPNGLDLAPFAAHAVAGRPRRVVVVANLRPEKGHDVLIEAAVPVLRRFPDARFEIVGGGPERPKLVALADARQVSRMRSRFSATVKTWPPGWPRPTSSCCRRDRRRFRTRCSRRWRPACRSSPREWAASRELIEEGRTGMLVPPDDPGRLADRLSALMAEPTLGARLGTAARAHAQAHYSFDRMVGAFEGIYLSELARRGVAAAASRSSSTS